MKVKFILYHEDMDIKFKSNGGKGQFNDTENLLYYLTKRTLDNIAKLYNIYFNALRYTHNSQYIRRIIHMYEYYKKKITSLYLSYKRERIHNIEVSITEELSRNELYYYS
uniref:Uncharacterized protein n=1 Tax=viral metagenome TaxID=1070528 RepID=A0A6C0LMM8_9ZZZZ